MGFSRQGHWSGLPFPFPGDLPDPEIKPGLLYCRQILYHLSYQGSPKENSVYLKLQRFAGSPYKSFHRGSICCCQFRLFHEPILDRYSSRHVPVHPLLEPGPWYGAHPGGGAKNTKTGNGCDVVEDWGCGVRDLTLGHRVDIASALKSLGASFEESEECACFVS